MAAGPVSLVADLDECGRPETVTLDATRQPALSVSRGGKVLARAIPREWKPWKLAICDADGDGTPEIAVGLRKATRFMPTPHNCLFLYWFQSGKIQPRWLGSRLSRPYLDFRFLPPRSGKAEALVALEAAPRGRSVALYRWSGFGFLLAWRRDVGTGAQLAGGDRDVVIVVDRGKQTRIPRRER